MKFNISSAKLTGTPQDTSWAQVHEFTPDDEEKLQIRGSLFAVVAAENINEEIVDSVSIGREILARLHEEYFGNSETSAFNTLKNAVEKVTEEFKGTLTSVEIAAVSIIENVVYSAASGGSKVVIFRDGMLAEILESSINKGDTVCASGYPQEDDILILATSGFFKAISSGSLKAALNGENLNNTLEALAPTIHSKDNSGKISAAFLKFEKDTAGVGKVFSSKRVEDSEEISSKKAKTRISANKILSTIQSKLPDKRIYVRKTTQDLETVQNKKVTISIGILLLMLLVVSIGFGVRQKKIKDEREIYESKLSQAQHEFDEALEVFSLNPQRARELFSLSRTKTNELIESGIVDSELDSLIEKQEISVSEVLGEWKADESLFIDLSLLSDGFFANDLATTQEGIYILDTNSEKVVSVSIETKRSEIVAGPSQIKNPIKIAAYANRTFLLTEGGIDEVGKNKRELTSKDWGNDAEIYSYAGNLYVLDKDASDVLRYSAVGEEFSTKQDWLAPGIEMNLSDVISWTIDGSVWMLDRSGKILRFSMGSPQNFSANGVFPQIENPTSIYTNEEMQHLYIHDPINSRIVAITKEGDYKAQYISEKLKNAKGFGVSEKEKKIIFLTTDKLYSIDIRH